MATGIIEGVLLGVITKCVTNGIYKIGSVAWSEMQDREFLERITIRTNTVQATLNEGKELSIEQFKANPAFPEEKVALFLDTAEVASIVRQVFTISGVEFNQRDDSIEIIKQQFCIHFANYLEVDIESCTAYASQIFNKLIECVEIKIDEELSKGKLSALEAKFAPILKSLSREIGSITTSLSSLKKLNTASLKEIKLYEQDYRKSVAELHKSINAPHSKQVIRPLLESLYVFPTILPTPNINTDQDTKFERIEDFAPEIYRTVILGDPGAGKSTFSQMMSLELATNSLVGRDRTPIMVVLRDFGAEKKKNDLSILNFIIKQAETKYQLLPPPAGTFEYLLSTGRAFVIFDGLDELLDPKYRNEIRDAVELFSLQYPSTPVLVTSRRMGYDLAPLDIKIFRSFRIVDFNEKQIETYIRKWFSLIPDDTPEQKERKIEAFLNESADVPDLRSNALMLGLMASIYTDQNYIPKNRPEVYKKCSEFLFDTWDRSRQISTPFKFSSEVRPVMSYLAYWLYTQNNLEIGIKESELLAKTTGFYFPNWIETNEKAEEQSRSLIDFCKTRAWIFTEKGEGIYHFTHQTFLEYFTALYINNQYRTPKDLLSILLPKIKKQEWDMVAQLAFQIRASESEVETNQIIDLLIDEIYLITDETESWNVTYFLIRSMQYIDPMVEQRKKVTDLFLSTLTNALRLGKTDTIRSSTSTLTNALLHTSLINRETVYNTIVNSIRKSIEDKDDDKTLQLLKIVTFLSIPYDKKAVNRETFEFWLGLTKFATHEFSDAFRRMGRKERSICYRALYEGVIGIKDIYEWHGINALFSMYMIPIFSTRYVSPAVGVIWNLLELKGETVDGNTNFTLLKQIGYLYSELDTIPQIDIPDHYEVIISNLIEKGEGKANILDYTRDKHMLFALFILFAIIIEPAVDSEKEMLVTRLNEEVPLISLFQKIYLYRLGGLNEAPDLTNLKSFFDEKQYHIIEMWLKGELDLVDTNR